MRSSNKLTPLPNVSFVSVCRTQEWKSQKNSLHTCTHRHLSQVLRVCLFTSTSAILYSIFLAFALKLEALDCQFVYVWESLTLFRYSPSIFLQFFTRVCLCAFVAYFMWRNSNSSALACEFARFVTFNTDTHWHSARITPKRGAKP